jgi:hypothetical protein
MHTFLGHFYPLFPCPSLPDRICSALSLILLKKRHKHNKEKKAFLLVELGYLYRNIPNVTFMYTCVTTHIDSSLTELYTGS